jgi:integrase
MANHNADNARIRHKYLIFLREAKGRDETTIDAVAKALSRFEAYTKFRDFKLFHVEQARGFKAHMAKQMGQYTGQRLSAATLYSTMGALKAFFQWLALQPGYKSRVQYADAEYFSIPAKDARIATARREQRVPTIEQILHVLQTMPSRTEFDRRDRAVVAFTLLTGSRDGATVSFRLGQVDVAAGKVEQDARFVNTKRAKTFTTYFFPVPDEVRQIVVDWVNYLRTARLWGDDAPLFPATEMGLGADQKLAAVGLARKHWTTAAPVRKIFKDAFAAAGLPYANPHSFRNTLVRLAYQLQLGPEEFKAWSTNLGHENMLTTFASYGQLSPYRQGEIIRGLTATPTDTSESELLAQLQKLIDRKTQSQRSTG